MGGDSADPTVVRSIAVSADDLAAALEAARRSGREPVLRITPPFSGRMRARLHDAATDSQSETSDADAPVPVVVDPEALVADTAPPYPTPAETEDRLRSDPDETYSRDRHRERHAEAVAHWRAAVTDHAVERVAVETPSGDHEVAVSILG